MRWFGRDRNAPTRLQAHHVYLLAPRVSDWSQWAELRRVSRELLVPWEPKWPKDALAHQTWTAHIRFLRQQRNLGQMFSWLIRLRSDDALVGGISLTNIRRGAAQSGMLGYWTGTPFTNRGLMKDAVGAVLRHGFGTLALHRVEAACLPGNAASRSILTHHHFRYEGVARRYLQINGSWRDHMIYARIAGEEQWLGDANN